jgi:hypothetical protein
MIWRRPDKKYRDKVCRVIATNEVFYVLEQSRYDNTLQVYFPVADRRAIINSDNLQFIIETILRDEVV